MAKRNHCRMGWGYTIAHKDAAAQHAKIREDVAEAGAKKRADDDAEQEAIAAVLRRAREDAQNKTGDTP